MTAQHPDFFDVIRLDAYAAPAEIRGELGSGLIDHSQKMTAAAMQIADMKVCAHRS